MNAPTSAGCYEVGPHEIQRRGQPSLANPIVNTDIGGLLCATVEETEPAMSNTTIEILEPQQWGIEAVEVSVCHNARDNTASATSSVAAVLQDIRNGRWRTSIEQIRSIWNNTKGDERQKKDAVATLKKALPGVMFSGRFSRRANEAMKVRSGLLCIDLDQLDGGVAEIRAKLADDSHVLAAFVSPTGTGLKVLVRINTSQTHLDGFHAAEAYFRSRFALEVDQSCKDPARLCFVSYDPDIYVADPSQVALMNDTPASSAVANASQLSTAASAVSAEQVAALLQQIPSRPEYDDWLRIASAVWSVLPMEEGCRVLAAWSPEEKPGEYSRKYENRLRQIGFGTLHWYAAQHRNATLVSAQAQPPKQQGGVTAKRLPVRAFSPAISTCSASSSDPQYGKAIFPETSILSDWMAFARRSSESEDSFLIGAILPVVAAALARRVWIEFNGPKYSNLYTMLAARPGFRKSTTIRMAEILAQQLIAPGCFTSSIASEEALFDEYCTDSGGSPDKLLVVDEGNTILANWSDTSYGKIVANRYLSLYDCGHWRQAFKKNRGNGGAVVRQIPATSTSIVLGATWNVSTFAGLEARTGMKRRFLHYVANRLVRTIYTPPPFNGAEFSNLVSRFKPLVTMQGALEISGAALDAWKSIQDSNRKRLQDVPVSASARDEILATMLAEEPSHTLKVAMLFAACEAAHYNHDTRRPTLTPEHLELASRHVQQCIEAGLQLEDIGRRQQTRDDADTILAHIRTDFAASALPGDDAIVLSKTELTRAFAANPGRKSGLTPDDLYTRIFPDLQRRGLCREYERTGKLVRYAFRLETAVEAERGEVENAEFAEQLDSKGEQSKRLALSLEPTTRTESSFV